MSAPQFDTGIPHSARVWNYWLGGTDNFAVDRQVGDQFATFYPNITVVARSSRAFLKRSITFLAEEAGIRQFLDVGTGMPTAEHTHQVAQAVAPDARIAYVDNDPLVLEHARSLLTGTPEGLTEYIDGDLRHPATIIEAARPRTPRPRISARWTSSAPWRANPESWSRDAPGCHRRAPSHSPARSRCADYRLVRRPSHLEWLKHNFRGGNESVTCHHVGARRAGTFRRAFLGAARRPPR